MREARVPKLPKSHAPTSCTSPPDSATNRTGEWGRCQAVEQLVREHQNWLIHLAASYLRDIPSSKDCVQDVFVTALTKIDTSLPAASQRSWLATCTIHRAKSLLRSARVRRLVPMNPHHLAHYSPSRHDDYAALDESGVLARVMELPWKYREVIVLKHYHELSVPDIAHILDISPHTVKTRLTRGMAKLRAAFHAET